LAQALAKFVEKVVPGTKPWVSSTGIDKGARFNDEIRNSLSDATGGIVCLTRENLLEPWILYEAGALSTKVADRLWTFLLDVDFTEVADPLKVINHTRAEKADVLKMMKSIQKIGAGSKDFVCTEAMVDEYFEAFWPKLEEKIEELRKTSVVPVTKPQPIDQVLAIVEQIGRIVSQSGWRQEKSLAMLHHIYTMTVGRPATTMKALKDQGPIPPGFGLSRDARRDLVARALADDIDPELFKVSGPSGTSLGELEYHARSVNPDAIAKASAAVLKVLETHSEDEPPSES
jgi:hypothetical protein